MVVEDRGVPCGCPHRHAQRGHRPATRHHRARLQTDVGHPVGGLPRRACQLDAGKPRQHDPIHLRRAHRHLSDERLAQDPLGRGRENPHRMGRDPAPGMDPRLRRSQGIRPAAVMRTTKTREPARERHPRHPPGHPARDGTHRPAGATTAHRASQRGRATVRPWMNSPLTGIASTACSPSSRRSSTRSTARKPISSNG